MTDHVCACAAASPARYRASSSAKAASMSSSVEPDTAAIAFVGVDLDDVEHVGVELFGRDRGRPRTRLRARRAPRVAMTIDVENVRRDRRRLACSRSRHLDLVESRRSPRDDDHLKCRRPASRSCRPSPGPEVRQNRSRLGLRRFPAAARRPQFSNLRERGVEICLVEDLAAVDQVAVDRR